MSSTEHVQRFEMLESRMTGSSTGFAATVEVGFRREPSNPPSSSVADPYRPRTPPMLGAAPESGRQRRSNAAPASAEKRPRYDAPAALPAAAIPAAEAPGATSLSGGLSSGGIRSFFQPKGSPAVETQPPPLAPLTHIAAASMPPAKTPTPRPAASRTSTDERAAAEARASALELRAAALETKLAAQAQEAREKTALLSKELEIARAEAEAATGVMEDLRKDISGVRDEQEEERKTQAAGTEALREALRQEAFRARAEARERLARESVRLGTLSQEVRRIHRLPR
jgi:hypothetical protein